MFWCRDQDSNLGLVVTNHPLAGFSAGDILPESVWCLSFRPWADPAGMVYDVNTDSFYLDTNKYFRCVTEHNNKYYA